ncbi:MAG: hypothetical protein HC900_03260 [Methylacidiphilales bacterium]|nr:hypothetical protein [Candidatus Methylacidiphilales bacterium]
MTKQETTVAEARSALDIIVDMESRLLAIGDFGEAIVLMAENLCSPEWGAFTTIGRTISSLVQELADERDMAARALMPTSKREMNLGVAHAD